MKSPIHPVLVSLLLCCLLSGAALGGEVPVYRFLHTNRGGHLYTISAAERDNIINHLPQYAFEGIKFSVQANAENGSTAVYRFFNIHTGIHLYTISEVERDAVMQMPQYNYEGVKFYVYAQEVAGSAAVYRFFNHVRGGHLYTISEIERDSLMDSPQWNYEGIKFYVLDYRFSGGDLFAIDPIVGKLLSVPATGPDGFQQGSPDSEACRMATEGPRFTHLLTRNILAMETEVTRRMWADLQALQPSLPDDPSHRGHSPTLYHPVQMITWYEAVLYANLLSIAQGLAPCYYADASFTTPIDASNYDNTNDIHCNFDGSGYRLPTEGEWEYVCRAGTTSPFSVQEPAYGAASCETCSVGLLPALESVCVFCMFNDVGSAPAGGLEPNPWNMHDVHGNVWEWCWDRWESVYPVDMAVDYTGPPAGWGRVIRGGGWSSYAAGCRSANRNSNAPTGVAYILGFRLVRTVP